MRHKDNRASRQTDASFDNPYATAYAYLYGVRKKCRICHQLKGIDLFPPTTVKEKAYYGSYCWPCDRIRSYARSHKVSYAEGRRLLELYDPLSLRDGPKMYKPSQRLQAVKGIG